MPAELDPRVRQLVVRLRRLKDHSGLSMRQLAAKTGYSPKSWERYLGGRSLPPEDAVEALARISGDDPSRLLALHEVAAEAWGDGHGGAAAADVAVSEAVAGEVAAAEPEILSAAAAENMRSPLRPVRIALVAGAVTLVLAVVSAVLLVVRLGSGDGDATAAPVSASAVSASASSSAAAARSGPTYACRLERIDGRWYAGNSRTQDLVLANGQAGPEVAEVQCLLRRAGFSPGDLDGIYGPLTERAVKRVQKRAGLVVDGIIGPHTWKALRG